MVERRLVGIGAALAALALLGACGAPSGAPRAGGARASTTTTTWPVPDTPEYHPAPAVLAVAAPASLTIPAIGVSTPLTPLGVAADGSMEVPTDFATAGWFTGGPRPGESGPAVIAGHVDSTAGPAVFFRLGELGPGDEVDVGRVDGTTARFTVVRSERVAKATFPTAEVFGPTPRAELRLVTCGGAFDVARRSYVDNVVVFARPS